MRDLIVAADPTCWESVRTELSAWAEPALAILGLLTLGGALWAWWERRRTVDLQVTRRARRVQRVVHEWLRDPSFDLTAPNRLMLWVERVGKGENEVQGLLEEMLDKAGGASRGVQRAARAAYSQFLRGADVVNKYGQPQLTGHTTLAEQAAAAKQYFESLYREVVSILPKDLL